MPRKRRAQAEVEDQDAGAEDANHSVLGGTKGSYRVNGDHADAEDGVKHFDIPFNDKSIICERRGQGEDPSLIFTHGAGGGIANPATRDFADGFGEVAPIVTFQGTMNLQSRVKSYHAVTEHLDFDAALGGRSMGARAAVITATHEDRKTKALVLVSFPLVGAKNKDSREQILLDLPEDKDVLFITGTKDGMCDLEQLAAVANKMKASCWFAQVEGADHGMSWKWKSSVEAMRRQTGALAAGWLRERGREKRHCVIRWDEQAEQVQCSGWQQEVEETEQASDAAETAAKPTAKRRKVGKKT